MWAVCSHLVDLRWTPGGGIINQHLAGGVCLFTTLFALFHAVQFALFLYVMCCYAQFALHTQPMHLTPCVICDVSHATLILFLPHVGHMNVGPRCMLHCIMHCNLHLCAHALGTCHYCPRRYGVPGSVDKYLPVPDCTPQKSLDIHSEGFSLC